MQQASRVHQACRVLQAHRVHQASRVYQAHREHQASRVDQASRVHQVKLVKYYIGDIIVPHTSRTYRYGWSKPLTKEPVDSKS